MADVETQAIRQARMGVEGATLRDLRHLRRATRLLIAALDELREQQDAGEPIPDDRDVWSALEVARTTLTKVDAAHD